VAEGAASEERGAAFGGIAGEGEGGLATGDFGGAVYGRWREEGEGARGGGGVLAESVGGEGGEIGGREVMGFEGCEEGETALGSGGERFEGGGAEGGGELGPCGGEEGGGGGGVVAGEEFADGGGVVREGLGPCGVAGEVETGESGEPGVGVGVAAEIAGFS
jgi:hypothetical protein